MAGGSSVIVCAVTLLLVLSCGADRLLNRQRAFETIMTQDLSMLNDKVSKMQENIETLTQMVNASLQQNGQAPDGSNKAVQDIERKLSRTTRQLHVAFAKQKMTLSNELIRMGEQVEEIQKKVLTNEIRMRVNEEKILGKLENYTQAVGEHFANVSEGCAESTKAQIDDVLLRIQNHTMSVGTQLQNVATSSSQNTMMQMITEISSQSKTAEKPVLQQMTSNLIWLVDGPSAGSGRIEIRLDDQWGTVCNDEFGANNNGATVVCRMLGYTRGVMTMSYGEGDGPIWLDNVICTGAESNILDCSRNLIGSHNCGHGEDIGVDCFT